MARRSLKELAAENAVLFGKLEAMRDELDEFLTDDTDDASDDDLPDTEADGLSDEEDDEAEGKDGPE